VAAARFGAQTQKLEPLLQVLEGLATHFGGPLAISGANSTKRRRLGWGELRA
jgi:hypothetical protein